MIPSGPSGKAFILEMTRLFTAFVEILSGANRSTGSVDHASLVATEAPQLL